PLATAPNRPHGAISTRGSWRSRVTLPLPTGVSTSSRSPPRLTPTGVDTGAPDRRNVVSDTNRWSARASSGVTATTIGNAPDQPLNCAVSTPGASVSDGPYQVRCRPLTNTG